MNDIAVAVRDLSTSYTIAHNAARQTMFDEALAHRLKNPLHRAFLSGANCCLTLSEVEV